MNLQQLHLESLDLLRTGVLMVSTSGNIVYANTAAQSFIGQSEKLLKERSLQSMIPESRIWLDNYASQPSPSFLIDCELAELIISPQETVPIFLTGHPSGDDPDILIFEFESAEKTLLVAHERHMNELSANTKRLLRNLAHEIKNPLGGIRGAAQLLESELQEVEHKEYTEVIISEADRLQNLVDKLLAPYRQSYHPVPTNVHEILERVRVLLQSEFPHMLEIERDYDISAPEINADKGQLTQIFLNLMRNAAEALSEKMLEGSARITLKTRVVHHVKIGDELRKAALNVHVIDNGGGISPEIVEKIFYPLVSTKESGSGLGLSLVQSFVDRHGGSISVSSHDGKTDFSLLFPLNNGFRNGN